MKNIKTALNVKIALKSFWVLEALSSKFYIAYDQRWSYWLLKSDNWRWSSV